MPKLFRRSESGARFMHHYSGGYFMRTGMMSLFYGIPETYWDAALKSNTPSVLLQAADGRGYDIRGFNGALISHPELHRTVFSNMPNLRLTPRSTS